jgi:hypothetical protein
MIKDVEELRAEKKVYVFRDMKRTLHRNIRLCGSETGKTLRPKSPCCPFGAGVNAARSAGILRSKEFKRYLLPADFRR